MSNDPKDGDKPEDSPLLKALRPLIEGRPMPEQAGDAILAEQIRQTQLRAALGGDLAFKPEG